MAAWRPARERQKSVRIARRHRTGSRTPDGRNAQPSAHDHRASFAGPRRVQAVGAAQHRSRRGESSSRCSTGALWCSFEVLRQADRAALQGARGSNRPATHRPSRACSSSPRLLELAAPSRCASGRPALALAFLAPDPSLSLTSRFVPTHVQSLPPPPLLASSFPLLAARCHRRPTAAGLTASVSAAAVRRHHLRRRRAPSPLPSTGRRGRGAARCCAAR